ncbi:flagellar motor switch protein FliG, partial [bacterium]|nr:flagellar motor switch protein FliG [bacterium]PIV76099.1 MAG: flagellar motor switch protein FliG [Rhodocyclales bacterium CG17_big_fil_post_rev_8_21_14_2_50_68_7]PJA75319.1 MAG: flagellar motor switch protein FliG [bacterium CG_4_9_14_3_um_filter_65_15]
MQPDYLRKASVFLMALGPDVAGKVMSKLPQTIVEEITHEIASIGQVTYKEKKAVLSDFIALSSRISGIAFGGEEAAKQILEAGFGSHAASSMLSRVTSYSEIKSFEHLKNVDSLTIANYLKNEHPQTIAVVLAHMDPRGSGPILALLPAELQGDVAHRMAVLEAPNPETLKEVEKVLAGQLQGEISARETKYGGKKQVAEILNEIEREVWQEILDEMREIDDEVANEVNNLMFIFDDVVTLSDASIQEILKEIDGKELTMALKGATDEIRGRIFGNMSKRAAEGIAEDMEYMGPVRLSEVEEAQQRIVEVIRSLEEAGTITLGKGGKDAEMVS